MKKLILLLVLAIGLMLPQVLSFGATRTISGSDVALAIDVSETTGYIVEESIPTGVTVSGITGGGNYIAAKKIIRWTKGDNGITSLSYKTNGPGTITGKIYGGDPSSEKLIIGEGIVPKAAACTPKTATCDSPGILCPDSIPTPVEGCAEGTICQNGNCVAEGLPPQNDFTVTAGNQAEKDLLQAILDVIHDQSKDSLLSKISGIAGVLKNHLNALVPPQ